MSEICKQGFVPDIVLMDISLPDADGVECAKWLHKEFAGKEIKCIAQTAHVMDDEIEDYKGNNFDDFIAKPYKKEELLDIINRNL
jgi:CheY-like chemotaxis protein